MEEMWSAVNNTEC